MIKNFLEYMYEEGYVYNPPDGSIPEKFNYLSQEMADVMNEMDKLTQQNRVEYLAVFDQNGKSLIKPIGGDINNVDIDDNSEIGKLLNNSEQESLITVHTHTTSGAFSDEDIKEGLKYNSIGQNIAIGRGNIIYSYNSAELKKLTMSGDKEPFVVDLYQSIVEPIKKGKISRDLTAKQLTGDALMKYNKYISADVNRLNTANEIGIDYYTGRYKNITSGKYFETKRGDIACIVTSGEGILVDILPPVREVINRHYEALNIISDYYGLKSKNINRL